jgi:hypothetical protein
LLQLSCGEAAPPPHENLQASIFVASRPFRSRCGPRGAISHTAPQNVHSPPRTKFSDHINIGRFLLLGPLRCNRNNSNANSEQRPSDHGPTTCFTGFDVLPSKIMSPPYTALIWGESPANIEVVNVAEPPFNDPVPSTVFPTWTKATFSPSGGAGVTTAVKVTACPRVDGFGEELSMVVVTRAAGLTSIAAPQPPVPGQLLDVPPP